MSGLYNSMFGMNEGAVFLLLPMLVDSEQPTRLFPRFRDVFLDGDEILVYTRVGGGNRSYSKEPPHDVLDGYDPGWDFHEDELYAMPTFLRTYDDAFDETYGYYVFGVPDEWREDLDAMLDGRCRDLSDAYCARVAACFGLNAGDVADVLRKVEGVPACLAAGPPDWESLLDALGTS